MTSQNCTRRVKQFQQVGGNRIEAVNILGGDYAAMGGVCTFGGGSIADLSISKIGGSGDVASVSRSESAVSNVPRYTKSNWAGLPPKTSSRRDASRVTARFVALSPSDLRLKF